MPRDRLHAAWGSGSRGSDSETLGEQRRGLQAFDDEGSEPEISGDSGSQASDMDAAPSRTVGTGSRRKPTRRKRSRLVPPHSRTSRYRGVYWEPKGSKWYSSISSNHKQIHLGSYETEEEAAHAFDQEAVRLRGPHTFTNFPGGSKAHNGWGSGPQRGPPNGIRRSPPADAWESHDLDDSAATALLSLGSGIAPRDSDSDQQEPPRHVIEPPVTLRGMKRKRAGLQAPARPRPESNSRRARAPGVGPRLKAEPRLGDDFDAEESTFPLLPFARTGALRKLAENSAKSKAREAGEGVPRGRGRRAVRPPVRHRTDYVPLAEDSSDGSGQDISSGSEQPEVEQPTWRWPSSGEEGSGLPTWGCRRARSEPGKPKLEHQGVGKVDVHRPVAAVATCQPQAAASGGGNVSTSGVGSSAPEKKDAAPGVPVTSFGALTASLAPPAVAGASSAPPTSSTGGPMGHGLPNASMNLPPGIFSKPLLEGIQARLSAGYPPMQTPSSLPLGFSAGSSFFSQGMGQGPYQIPPMSSAATSGGPALSAPAFSRPYQFYIRNPPASSYALPSASHPPGASHPQAFPSTAMIARLDASGRPIWDPIASSRIASFTPHAIAGYPTPRPVWDPTPSAATTLHISSAGLKPPSLPSADSKPAAQLPPPGPRNGDNAQPHASTCHAPQSSAAQFSNWGPGKPAFSAAQPTSQPPAGLHVPNAPATQPAPGGRLPMAPAAATPSSCPGNGGPLSEAANGRGPQEEAPAKLPAGRGEGGGQAAQEGKGGSSVLAVAPGLPGLPQGVPVDVSVKTR